MKQFWTAAFAATLLVGAYAGSTTALQAGASKAGAPQAGASKAGEASRSVHINLGTKAYRKRQRHHRRHRTKRHAYHRSHRRHGAHRRHTRPRHHYSRRAHGPRYRARRPGYTYHYAGYWYAAARWVPVRVGSHGGRHLSHAEWCYQQYGAYYHARSNTYLASDGNAYHCIRPSGW